MAVRESDLRLAVRNVALWGDTDILPFPIENHWLHDHEDGVISLLQELDSKFEDWLVAYPVHYDRVLSGVGHLGFRATTQIDAVWNAYLLALLVRIGSDIEKSRVNTTKSRVFSYRFAPSKSDSTLFDRSIGWHAFQMHALEFSKNFQFVVSTDISNFYPRIYHHRIENALAKATKQKEVVQRIKILLNKLSVSGVSYGLPVGGNAARILAEVVLDRTDKLLHDKSVKYCRFVDDYYLFADSEEEARRSLFYLSDMLMTHEGLDLQRSKTRLMTRQEFRQASPLGERELADSAGEADARDFLRLRIMYDPYSPTASEDFERLKGELERFDVVGMLAREMRKSRIDETLTKQLVKSIKYLSPQLRDNAVLSLVHSLEVLYPVLPTVCLVFKGLLTDLSASVRDELFERIRLLIHNRSHLFLIPSNLSYAIRLLVHDQSAESHTVLNRIYVETTSPTTRRDLILAFALRGADHWVADALKKDPGSPWELRALLTASYTLDDEGRHWRDRQKRALNSVDKAFLRWVGSKNNGGSWEIPL